MGGREEWEGRRGWGREAEGRGGRGEGAEGEGREGGEEGRGGEGGRREAGMEGRGVGKRVHGVVLSVAQHAIDEIRLFLCKLARPQGTDNYTFGQG